MASAGTLSIDVVAGIASLQRDFATVSQATTRLSQQMVQSFDQVNTKLTQVQGALGQIGTALNNPAFGRLGQNMGELATAAGNLSTALGGVGSAVGLIGRFTAVGAAVGVAAAAWDTLKAAVAGANVELSRSGQLAALAASSAGPGRAFDEFARTALIAGGSPVGAAFAQVDTGERLFRESLAPLATELRAIERQSVSMADSVAEARRQLELLFQTTGERGEGSSAARLVAEQVARDARREAILAETQQRMDALRRIRQAPLTALPANITDPRMPTGAAPSTRGGGGSTTDPDAALIERLERLRDPFRVFDQEFAEIQRLFESNRISVETYDKALEDLSRRQNTVGQSTQQLQQPLTETQLLLVNFSDEITKALVAPFFEAEQDIGKSLLNILRKIIEFIVQMTVIKPLLTAAVQFLPPWLGGTTSAGGGPKTVQSGAAATSGGQRAAGGAVLPGTSYTVGEFGPERFVPNTPGVIDPLSGGVVVNVYNQAEGTTTRQEQRRNPFGGKEIDIYIEKVVNAAFANGRFDNTMGANFGAARVGRV